MTNERLSSTHSLLMQEMIVVVLDMDETLGVFEGDHFHVRPNVNFIIQMLHLMKVDIILWSLGDDDYVKKIVNGFLPLIASYAYKIFARAESKVAYELYGYSKAGEHIREMYEDEIYLIGIDDQVATNMNSAYDFKIYVRPYRKPDKKDRTLLYICEKLVNRLSSIKS